MLSQAHWLALSLWKSLCPPPKKAIPELQWNSKPNALLRPAAISQGAAEWSLMKKKKEEPIADLSRWRFWQSPRYSVITAAGQRQRQIQKAPLVLQNICSDFKWKGGIVTQEGVITTLQMAPTALHVNIMEPARAKAEWKQRLTH